MAKKVSKSRGKPARKPWPRYTHLLKSPLKYDGDISGQIDQRLADACSLYNIDKTSADWDRQLLATLLTRHVPGFRFQTRKTTTNDDVYFIETVETVREQLQAETGQRPSIDAVVQTIIGAPKEDNPFHGRSHSRLMRVYSDRKKILGKSTFTSLGPLLAYQEAVRKAGPSSFVSLIKTAILKRYT